jgi:hypothetical protein
MPFVPLPNEATPCHPIWHTSLGTPALPFHSLSHPLSRTFFIIIFVYMYFRQKFSRYFLSFVEDLSIAKEADYTICGRLTESAVYELMAAGGYGALVGGVYESSYFSYLPGSCNSPIYFVIYSLYGYPCHFIGRKIIGITELRTECRTSIRALPFASLTSLGIANSTPDRGKWVSDPAVLPHG